MSCTEKAFSASRRAVEFDNEKKYEAAIYYYTEASRYLYLAVTNGEGTEQDRGDWAQKSKEYDKRVARLREAGEESSGTISQSFDHQALQRCNFLFGQALDADEKNIPDIAVDLYGQTAEYALKVKGQITDSSVQQKILQRAKQALTRAEELKFSNAGKDAASSNTQTPKDNTAVSNTCNSDTTPDVGASLKISGGSTGYSEEEKLVLLSTSKINGINYVPFMDIDLRERFQYALPFTDKHGLLKLSPKQRLDFNAWARPEELFPEPKMIVNGAVNFQCIKQTLISDCSFVASLAVSAQYERQFSRRIITGIIFPRNRSKEPIYNPFGKYMIKFHINGVPRKVIIDDQLPVDRHGRLLCSYSTQKGELWVSLLEKAYMKVMGGYDFPGSNSSIDLHALTGWIPERIPIRPNEPDFNANAVFDMLESRMRSGHCLATVATGELSALQEERTGLVPCHAYALLNVVTVKGVRLMQLKNPWSHIRWKGNYSELDTHHWTPALRAALNFDPDSAATFDNGIFWIDYESMQHFFDVIYLNWNPDIFSFTYCIHQQWRAGQGPARDVYNIGENPQFSLHIPGTKPGSVWILLSRHITDVADFKDNTEYIAVVVYKTNGSKVYYPHDPPPYIDGARINSPHYLCKIVLGENSSRSYTLVISQYEKTTNILYTLRAYATLPFHLKKIDISYPYTKQLSGQWKGVTAGGCPNHRATFSNNPCLQLKVEAHGRHSVLMDLKGPKQYQIGFVVEKHDDPEFASRSSGAYRTGFVVLELDSITPGVYSIIPATFNPGQEGPFIFTLKATCPFSLTTVR